MDEQNNEKLVEIGQRMRKPKLTKAEIDKKAAEVGASDTEAFTTKQAFELQMTFQGEITNLAEIIDQTRQSTAQLQQQIALMQQTMASTITDSVASAMANTTTTIKVNGVTVETLNRVVPVDKQEAHGAMREALFSQVAAMKEAKVKNGKIVKAVHQHAAHEVAFFGLEGKVRAAKVLSPGEVAAGAFLCTALGVGATMITTEVVDRRKLRKAGKTKEEKEAFYAQDRTVRAETTL